MSPSLPLAPRWLSALALMVLLSAGGDPVVECWPDGSPRLRYELDQEGRIHGELLEYQEDGTLLRRASYRAGVPHGREFRFHPDGSRRSVASWADGVLHGRFESFHQNGKRDISTSYSRGQLSGKHVESSADGRRVLTASYARGLLDGPLSIKDGSRTLTRQVWSAGELESLDGLRPFPRRRAELVETLERIERAPAAAATEGIEAERAAALRRLQVYRDLCGLAWEGMELSPEWNELCTAAAEVCRALGRLSHQPERPPGMDEQRYRQGLRGAQNSNLAAGSRDLAASVDSYMDDSDPSNIGRVGHRRWCLNPTMRKTGFGRVESWSAMWSMDSSGGGGARGPVLYPPAGWVPVDCFGPRHAWSVSIPKGRRPALGELQIEITALDDHYLPFGEALELDHRGVADGGFGDAFCVIFRPAGLIVADGERYRCRLSFDGGKSYELDYLVEFFQRGGDSRD